MKQKISFCTIVYNEEKLIRNMLESIKDWCFEIIIVDNGSTDKTVEICKEYGATVIIDETKDDLAYLRNVGLKRATGDWVFSMDGDESVSVRDVKRILDLAKSNESDGFHFTSRLYTDIPDIMHILGRCKGEYEKEEKLAGTEYYIDLIWAVRLFRRVVNGNPVEYEGYIHEMIGGSIKKNKGIFYPCDVKIHHYKVLELESSPEDDIRQRFELEKKNSEIDSLKNHMGHWYRLGRDYALIDKNLQKSNECYEKATEFQPELAHYLYFLIGWNFYEMQDYNNAYLNLNKAIELNQYYFAPHFMKAQALKMMDHEKEMEKELAICKNLDAEHPVLKGANPEIINWGLS